MVLCVNLVNLYIEFNWYFMAYSFRFLWLIAFGLVLVCDSELGSAARSGTLCSGLVRFSLPRPLLR